MLYDVEYKREGYLYAVLNNTMEEAAAITKDFVHDGLIGDVRIVPVLEVACTD